MQCPNCGHWNEVGSRFCEECGLELPKEAQAGNPVSVRATAMQPSAAADAPDAIDFSEFADKPAAGAAAVSAVPPIPSDQQLTPMSADSQPVPYTGPRLTLKSTGSIFRLGDATVIGRESPTLQIDLDGYPDGKYISHRHAQIVKMNDKFYIEDLGSSNHTYVNDLKLAQGQAEPLNEGDTVRLGKIELEFHES